MINRTRIVLLNQLKRTRWTTRDHIQSRWTSDGHQQDHHQDDHGTQFGFERVTRADKLKKVNKVFSSVADSYDLMNDVMSVGIHRVWKDRFIKKMDPMQGTRLLDVAGGTGDIAFRFINHASINGHNKSYVVVCDINEHMLEVGKKRAKSFNIQDDQIQWVHGDAMNLPFEENTFDVYSIAFGIRNVVDIEKALSEALRVLKPGGMFMCLEFSRVKNPGFHYLYNWYSFQVIPVLGEILAGDWRSYQYLVESIKLFPDQVDFQDQIESAGFIGVDHENLFNGIAAIHRGYKRCTQ